MKGRTIEELVPGQSFADSVFLIRGASRRTTKTGNAYLACSLADGTGSADAKWFNTNEEQLRGACGARFVRVSGMMQSGDFEGDIRVDRLQPVPVPDDLGPFLEPLPAGCDEQQACFQDLIATVEQPYLRSLLEAVFDPDGHTWSEFCGGVAATKFHHAYRGGLLDHTLEVAQLCDATCSVVPGLRRDFLITAALLHDIGKLEEMDHGLAAGEYSAAGNLIGHIVLGTCTVATAADTIAGFPLELKHGLMHMILSHHGKLEYGSAKTPLCAEAQVLSMNDMLSAKLNQCQTALAGALEGQHSAAVVGWDSRSVYCGSFGLDGGSAAAAGQT